MVIVVLKGLLKDQVNTTEFYTFLDHLMKSKGTCCYAPSKRYCEIGLRLKKEYEESERTRRTSRINQMV